MSSSLSAPQLPKYPAAYIYLGKNLNEERNDSSSKEHN